MPKRHRDSSIAWRLTKRCITSTVPRGSMPQGTESALTCDVLIEQQHNRCQDAFLPASSKRNEEPSKKTGAREPAIRFRGNDTPSALIRRPGVVKGTGKGCEERGMGAWAGNTFPVQK